MPEPGQSVPQWKLDPSFEPARAVVAGVAGAFVYLAVMYADMAITRSQSDDLLMLGRPLTRNGTLARLIGLPIHVGFGATLALIYGGYGRRHLRGPNWLRGASMLMIENTVLWPGAVVADRFHPSMRAGELPRLNTPIPFAQQVVRHLAFGVVLGRVYGAGRACAETPGYPSGHM